MLGQIVAVEIGDPVTVGGDRDGLVLSELDRLAGVTDERGDIGADEHLALADADHQRRRAAGRDDGAWVVGVGEHQSEVALEAAQHSKYRGGEIACRLAVVIIAGDEVDGDFGVGVAGELDAGGFEFVPQRHVVFDDAVVDDGDLARRVAVRVRVAVGGSPVRRPAGVAHTGRSAQGCGVGLGKRALQIRQPAGAPPNRQVTGAVDQRDTGRVVTPVLHPAQCVDDDIEGRLVPDVADDSAHSPSE